MKARIERIEYSLPDRIEDNAILQSENPDWRMDEIVKKTGIHKRYVAAPSESAGDLGLKAAQKLFASEYDRSRVDCLIFVTQSPDYSLPTTACILQDRLGLSSHCMAFDVNLGCSGYVYALSIAAALIETSTVSNALVICAETYSKYIAKTDRTCRPIFSDAAAATLVVASKSDCIGPFDFGTDGSGALNLVVLNSGAKSELMADGRLDRTIFMNGSAVFMFTMKMVPVSVMNLVRKRGISIDEIDLFIFHQASQLVLENIVRRLQLKPEKVFLNMGEIGNTVSASIPIAIKDAVNRGVLKPGQRIMLVGFGVGYSWGACLVEWGG